MIELISMFCDDCGKLRIIVIAFLTIDGLVFEKFLDILRVLRELPLFLFCLDLSVDFSNNLFNFLAEIFIDIASFSISNSL